MTLTSGQLLAQRYRLGRRIAVGGIAYLMMELVAGDPLVVILMQDPMAGSIPRGSTLQLTWRRVR